MRVEKCQQQKHKQHELSEYDNILITEDHILGNCRILHTQVPVFQVHPKVSLFQQSYDKSPR